MRSNTLLQLLISTSITTQHVVFSFAPPSLLLRQTNRHHLLPSTTTTTTISKPRLQMAMTGDEIHQLNELHTAFHDSILYHSHLLAEAADAAVEVAESGWWQNFLDFFKNSLIFVHSSIDAPLRSVGVEQTWGPSIALFTAGVRTALVPLSIQQSKSAEYMKALKPYQDEIREKFKDRKETMNRAIAKLFEDTGTNPFAGCLFSLLQLPVFLGLYRSVTLLAKDGQLGEPFLWIPCLDGPVSPPTYRGMEWLTTGWSTIDGILTPQLGWETTLKFVAMPVILVLGQSLTMSVLQPSVEQMSEEEKEQMEKSGLILKFLPLLIGYFSLQVPAGLTIYWLTSNIYTLMQSLAVKAYYAANPPKIDLPDYWDALDDVANMSPEERRKAAEAGIAAGPDFGEMLDEARFHYMVERHPLRESSVAWERVQAKKEEAKLPTELSSWVASSDEWPKAVESTPTPEKSTV